eukprot:scaffold1167_cov418-Prasinococcus_capsulatus_cf.AAC.11
MLSLVYGLAAWVVAQLVSLLFSSFRNAAITGGGSNLNWNALTENDFRNLRALAVGEPSNQRSGAKCGSHSGSEREYAGIVGDIGPAYLGWFSTLPNTEDAFGKPFEGDESGDDMEGGDADLAREFQLSSWRGDWARDYDTSTCQCFCERDLLRIPRKQIASGRSTLPMSLLRVSCQRNDNSSKMEDVVSVSLPTLLGEGTLHVVYQGDVLHSVSKLPMTMAVSMLIPKDKGKAKSEKCIRNGKSNPYDCAHGRQFMEHVALLNHLSGHPGVLSLFGAGYCSACQDTKAKALGKEVDAIEVPTGVMLLPLGKQQSWKDIIELIHASPSSRKLALAFITKAVSLFQYLTEDRRLMLGDMDAYTVARKVGNKFEVLQDDRTRVKWHQFVLTPDMRLVLSDFDHHEIHHECGPSAQRVWEKVASYVCFSANAYPGNFTIHTEYLNVTAVRLVHRSGRVSNSPGYVVLTPHFLVVAPSLTCCHAMNRTGTYWGAQAAQGDKPISTFMTDTNRHVIAPDFQHDPRVSPLTPNQYMMEGSGSKDKQLDFSLDDVSLGVGQYQLWYGDKLRGYDAEENHGYTCADVHVQGCPLHKLQGRLHHALRRTM